MIDTFFGLKEKMTSRYDRAGRYLPVTVVKVPECVVTQVKTKEKDGYMAVQLAFGAKKAKNLTSPIRGRLSEAGVELSGKAPAFFGEVKVEDEKEASSVKLGEKVQVGQVFHEGDMVAVSGISKGKGFAGVVKRHSFAGGPKTHGQSDRLRAPGSIGSGTDPGRVWPGLKMAGHMGGEQVTVKGLVVVKVDNEKGEMWISGAIPGGRGAAVRLVKTGVVKEFHPILEPGEGFSVKEAAEEEAKMEQGLGLPEEGENGGEASGEKKEAAVMEGGKEA